MFGFIRCTMLQNETALVYHEMYRGMIFFMKTGIALHFIGM